MVFKLLFVGEKRYKNKTNPRGSMSKLNNLLKSIYMKRREGTRDGGREREGEEGEGKREGGQRRKEEEGVDTFWEVSQTFFWKPFVLTCPRHMPLCHQVLNPAKSYETHPNSHGLREKRTREHRAGPGCDIRVLGSVAMTWRQQGRDTRWPPVD